MVKYKLEVTFEVSDELSPEDMIRVKHKTSDSLMKRLNDDSFTDDDESGYIESISVSKLVKEEYNENI